MNNVDLPLPGLPGHVDQPARSMLAPRRRSRRINVGTVPRQ